MTLSIKLAAIAALVVSAANASAQPEAPSRDHVHCTMCKEWNEPLRQAPFKLAANTYYVGTKLLSSVLISGPDGLILIDGALPQSARIIERNIRELGFRIKDVKFILNSHAHFDHAGGIAALQAASGATVVASANGAQTLRDGSIGPDDPQSETGKNTPFPKVDKVRVVTDGEVVTLGTLKVTARMTPGHTPGSTTWTWTDCDKGSCVDVVYADSLNPASREGFRFNGSAGTADLSASFRASIDKVAALKCDVIVGAHPDFTDLMDRLARSGSTERFIDPDGCRKYAGVFRERLEKRLASEALAPAPK